MGRGACLAVSSRPLGQLSRVVSTSLAIISSGMLAVTHPVAEEKDGQPPSPQPTLLLATK